MSLGKAIAAAAAFEREMQQVAAMLRRTPRALRRLMDSPGERHIDRIVHDCLDRRLPAEQTAIRLIAASDLAAVLDGEAGA